ncbi:MAG: multiheme c-type cytochrome [Bryobacteraceae bacterium]
MYRCCGLVLALIGLPLAAQSMAGGGASGLVWPSEGEYAGSKQCAICHPALARSYHGNSMFRALEPIESCEILRQNPKLEWTDGRYSYVIEKSAKGFRYQVTDGKETAETLLRWAFGQGKAGQTYVFERDGRYFESRVSYYQQLNGLGLTVGALNEKPASLVQALGRSMGDIEARDCFGCHTTGARRGNALHLDKYEDGVQCESCHGPGAAHVASISDGKPKPGTIRSLKGLNAEETSDLCGACHRTWETVILMKIRGTNNVRFQPYRMTNSSCFLSGDPRIACTACHNPHGALVHDAGSYDAKCAACHNRTNAAIQKQICPVGKQDCVSCHMPRYEVPGSNHAFADHWIRVARNGEPYPN